LPYKVIWSFGDGACETATYDNVLDARQEAFRLSTQYAREHGACNTQLFAGEQLVFDLKEASCG